MWRNCDKEMVVGRMEWRGLKKWKEMMGPWVSVWVMENNGQQFIVAILTSAECTDARDRILMSAFHHFAQTTAV